MFRDVSGRDGIAAVLAPAQREPRGGDVRKPAVRRGMGAAGGGAHDELWQVDSRVAREVRGPCPAREHDPVGSYLPVLGLHATHPAACRFDGADRAVLGDRHPEPVHRARQRRHRDERLPPPVARGQHPPDPPPLHAGNRLARLRRREHSRVELMLSCEFVPLFELGKLPLVLRQIHAAGCGEREVLLPGLLGETPPDPVRLHHDRQLVPVPPLLAHPAPVAARLLACDPPLFDERDLCAPSCQEPGVEVPMTPAPITATSTASGSGSENATGVDSEIIGMRHLHRTTAFEPRRSIAEFRSSAIDSLPKDLYPPSADDKGAIHAGVIRAPLSHQERGLG